MSSHKCPECGAVVGEVRNPYPTVDIIIHLTHISIHSAVNEYTIVLIERKNPPHGWALPGGFIDYGEKAEDAAVREAKEETSLDINYLDLIGVYSDPKRDPRAHTMSVVYRAWALDQVPVAQDDAKTIKIVSLLDALKMELAFDHKKILEDYVQRLLHGPAYSYR
jgi:8-oxo-dGTP diphosphatase